MRAWLCYLKENPHDHWIYSLKIRELESLSSAAGYTVVGFTTQTRNKPHPALMFGYGKLEDVKTEVTHHEIGTVVFYNILSSKQQYNLTRMLKCKVIDRYDLTLEIFEQNSLDDLSKIQIMLAKVIKEIPHTKMLASLLYKSDKEHPGPKSLGEYSYHKIIANLHRRKAILDDEIERRRIVRILQLRKRKEMGLPTVCVTGYYNAGKTSLFNVLTNMHKEVGRKPFTTLSSKYCLVPTDVGSFFLIDTIGFVIDLDPRLIASFSLTLDDLRHSDLVLFLIDVGDSEEIMRLRIETCIHIMKELGVDFRRLLLVLSKCDLIKSDLELDRKIGVVSEIAKDLPNVVISSRMGRNLDLLVGLVLERLNSIETVQFDR